VGWLLVFLLTIVKWGADPSTHPFVLGVLGRVDPASMQGFGRVSLVRHAVACPVHQSTVVCATLRNDVVCTGSPIVTNFSTHTHSQTHTHTHIHT